jgi:hypothetical protein
VFVELRQQVEQQSATRLAKGQVAQLIQYNEIQARKALRDTSWLVYVFLVFKRVYQIDR